MAFILSRGGPTRLLFLKRAVDKPIGGEAHQETETQEGTDEVSVPPPKL